MLVALGHGRALELTPGLEAVVERDAGNCIERELRIYRSGQSAGASKAVSAVAADTAAVVGIEVAAGTAVVVVEVEVVCIPNWLRASNFEPEVAIEMADKAQLAVYRQTDCRRLILVTAVAGRRSRV